MDWEYLGNSLAWGVTGLTAGWVAGRYRCRHGRHQEDRVTTQSRRKLDVVVAVAVLLMSMASIAGVALNQHRDDQRQACQDDYNEAFRRAIIAGREASETDRRAMVQLVQAVTEATSREDTRTALLGYLSSTAQAEKVRAAHPLPELSPAQACPPGQSQARGVGSGA